jgi:hypothetical protein
MILNGMYISDEEYEEVFGYKKGGKGSGDSHETHGGKQPSRSEKSKIENDIKIQTQLIWDKNFPGQKATIISEYEKLEGGYIRISTEIKSKIIPEGAGMMSTISLGRKDVTHDDYFLDEKLHYKGFSTSHIKYIEAYAQKKGCTKAVLQASEDGRVAWPKLGFKCQSRKTFLDVKAFGKLKGIEINSERDFHKLKEYFKTDKNLKEDIIMTKKINVFPVQTQKKGFIQILIGKYRTITTRELIEDSEIIGGNMAQQRKMKETKIDDKDICPLCGWKLEGGWCINPDCEVLDDADDYKREKKGDSE